MRLHSVRIRNFRCYKEEVSFNVGDLTALVGANDAGKSTILDALSIFFDVANADEMDACLHGDRDDMAIICEFSDLPSRIVIDATSSTTLQEEFLLNEHGRLEIHRIYNGTLKKPSSKTFINAVHPTHESAKDLLSLKSRELISRATDVSADLTSINQRINAELRALIRGAIDELSPALTMLAIDSPGAKEIYPKIQEALPSFFLFKSDRPSTDQDSEAQDPMKAAVKIAIEQQAEKLSEIATSVEQQLELLVAETLSKIRDMAPEVASELQPRISPPKWDSVFKIALTGDSEIPLNKRGSGVRRIVLLGFLQAQVASYRISKPDSGIIYAIEEPETSQHPDRQLALLNAMREIADDDGFQVMFTTHTPALARRLAIEDVRYVEVSEGSRVVSPGSMTTIDKVRDALGILPDHDVKLFIGVEGSNDEAFLKGISEVLSQSDEEIKSIESLEAEGRVVFITTAGSNIGSWVSRLNGLNIPEFYLFDRDNQPPLEPHYKEAADVINAKENSEAHHTSKRELENYIHKDAIALVRGDITLPELNDFDDLPQIVAQLVHEASESTKSWVDVEEETKKKKTSSAKKWLNAEAVKHMTVDMLSELDPGEEVVGWLRKISQTASQ